MPGYLNGHVSTTILRIDASRSFVEVFTPVRSQAFISDGLIFVKCLRITKSSINEPSHGIITSYRGRTQPSLFEFPDACPLPISLSLSLSRSSRIYKREIGGTYEVMYTVGRYTTSRHGSTTILSTSTPFIVRHPLSAACMNGSRVRNCSHDTSAAAPRKKGFLGKY